MSSEYPLTLAIETSNPSAHENAAGVALVRLREGEPQIIGIEHLRTASRHDDALMPAIERLFDAANLAPQDLDRVAVSIGPGGYTSTRIERSLRPSSSSVRAANCSNECLLLESERSLCSTPQRGTTSHTPSFSSTTRARTASGTGAAIARLP